MPNAFRKGRELLKVTRRRALTLFCTLPFVATLPAFAAARRTPPATEGPFYPTHSMRFADADNDLVKIAGLVEDAGGEVIVLKGHIRDRAGRPVAGARVEIWQCDANGRYLHTGDRAGGTPRDPAFQGFGYVVTGADGAYAFRTIKPVSYPGRTPHIHAKIIHRRRVLTTQFYIAGHKQNAGDWLYQRMSSRDQRAVSMVFANGADILETTVDIVL